jgi:hypothetical protein
MSVSEYKNIDFSPKGQLATDLLDAAAYESESEVVAISGEHQADESRPAYLTPVMQEWFRAYVVPLRSPALQEIRQRFNSIDLGKGQHGFLIESEKDRIAQKKFLGWEQERNQFFSDGEAVAVAKELDVKLNDYEYKKIANGGEDAREWPKKYYILALAALAIPELPLNFESMMKIPYVTPAIATALIFAIAVGIARSSHIYGICIRQWSELFGGHVSATEKMRNIRWLGIGSILFAISMTVVIGGRYLLFSEEMNRKILIGEGLKAGDYAAFGFTLGGNILIWVLGISIAYSAHSHVPGFGELKNEVENLRKRLLSMYARELQPRVERHLNAAQKELSTLEQAEARILRQRPDYVALRSEFEELKKVDNRVIAILESYRSRLLDKSNRSRKKIVLVMDELSRQSPDTRVEIPSDVYQLKKIVLPYAQNS